jgi:ankyrin repeat protein
MSWLPIHALSLGGNIQQAAWLIERDPGVLEAPDPSGMTALTHAASRGHVGLVTFLLDQGAKINHRDRDGDSVLIMACASGREAVVRLLLGRGADPSLASETGWTALISASNGGHVGCVRVLLEHGGVDVDAADSPPRVQSAIHYAAWRGHREVVAMLLQAGADGAVTTYTGQTTLDLAKRMGRTRLAEDLEVRGPCVKLDVVWVGSPLPLLVALLAILGLHLAMCGYFYLVLPCNGYGCSIILGLRRGAPLQL